MGDEKYSRGKKNPHMRTTEKKPCDKCGQLADHYPDGIISKHKVYVYKEVNGVMQKTTKWSYCSKRRWD